ncbi:MAG: sporulation protein [Deltaproteobacteria bacterium]|nr:sporulation protein [Deltaproteobacteria bacterium]
MKALFFARPIEYRLESSAENLLQGDSLQGTLTAANRGSEPLGPLTLGVALAFGQFKKVKDTGPGACKALEKIVAAEGVTLAPGQEHKAPWSLTLPPDSPVTGKNNGPFLLYGGDLSKVGDYGFIDLPVKPSLVPETFLTVVETRFSFEPRGMSWSGGFIQTTLKPSGAFPNLEELGLGLHPHAEGLDVVFTFKLKAFQRPGSKAPARKVVEIKRSLTQAECLLGQNLPNRNLFHAISKEVIDEALPPGMR